MRQHLEDAALQPLHGEGEHADGDEAHMGDGGIGDELLHVLLRERHERGVDDGDHRQREDQRRELGGGEREHRDGEAQEAVAAHLQEDAGKDHGARGRRLDMGVRQPGMHRPHGQLHGEGGEEGKPQPGLHRGREAVGEQRRDVGGAGLPIDRHDGEQHQQRAGERVEEELEARIDAARTAPDADDEEHRDQAALEEQIEQHEVEAREHADHQRLEHEEGDHIFLHPRRDRLPARQDAERHQQRGEEHEGQGDAVDAHMEVDRPEPGALLDELELRRGGIEVAPQQQRQREGDERGPQRDEAGVAGGASSFPRRATISSAPSSGRKVTVERIGQEKLISAALPRQR